MVEPTFVLLHGFGTSSREWVHVAEQLAGVRSLHPDLPGFGTCAAQGACSVSEMAEVIAGAIGHAGHRDFVLVGRELGALVALELAARQPPGLLGVALVHPAWRADPETVARLRTAHGNPDALRAHYAAVLGSAPDERDLENLILDGLRASKEAWNAWLDQAEEPPRLPDVPVSLPVLIVSDNDSPVPSLPQASIQTLAPESPLLPLQAPGPLTRQLLHWSNNLVKEARA
ncbi:alpha/beta fold hydrolase [Deinococcus peraridilitoris]|uniref:AB hydrolase-1 domain-containing protein n=1 Tax=Deinococcus peraridilitoris (strain DSM 19664 / LMG 22246 / CIP 109416 / KR-200) TaxID=937777 RepID=L0A671_DEIPD|nr:alpha/beta fold hydrolase [Deinococcus peraridilitoris]AFZ68652.1 hypothetical protein Deipe_3209 [Deinococcus peraridilitoris DSM 19664]